MMMNMQLLMPIAQSLMTLMMTPGKKMMESGKVGKRITLGLFLKKNGKMIPGTLDQTGMMTGQLIAKTGAKSGTMITGMKLIKVLRIGHKMNRLKNGMIPGLLVIKTGDRNGPMITGMKLITVLTLSLIHI